jgi:signal transduction histidine kinase/DNA-binding response OmpR family regulator/CHASE3 domain sensor protein
MKLSNSNWLIIGSALTISIGVGLGVSFFNTIQRQLEEASWIKAKYETINNILTLEKLLVDMETGQRAYRNTNERKFLLPFIEAESGILEIENNLTEAVSNNPKQLARVAQIQKLTESLVRFWDANVTTGQFLDRQNAIIFTELEKKNMDEIRRLIKKVYEVEQEELEARQRGMDGVIEAMTRRTVIGTALLFIIAAILTYFYFLEFKNRKKIESQLNESVIALEQLNRSSSERNWYLTGLTVMYNSLQDAGELEELGTSILKAMSEYLDAPAAGFYICEDNKLILKASIALPAQTIRTYELGEGLVGQAALGKEINITKSVPASYWSIESGMGVGVAGQIACIPLWYGKELKGVIELASFTTFSDLQKDLLKRISKDISVAVNVIQSRHKIVRLLQQLQQQTAILENQQDELRQTNEELTRQAESLVASGEELRVQEEELRHINAELEEKNEAVEVAHQSLAMKAKELEEASRFKSEFLANMSHELRTPLNSVLILANLLAENKNKNLTVKQVEYAQVIYKSGSNLLQLINDILDLSKIEAGKVDFQFESVPVKNIIKNINQLFSVVAEGKDIHFVTVVDDSVPENLYTDKQRLEQVIQNLLSNSFKFTPKKGTVTLSFTTQVPQRNLKNDVLKNAEQILAISVADTGIGIPPEKQQLIFEAFQQADGSTSRKYGGTGLGLSIIKELVKRLDGEIRLESEAGKGSTFTIFLPIQSKEAYVHFHGSQQITLSEKENNTLLLPANKKEMAMPVKVDDDRLTIEKGDLVMLIIEDDPHFAGIVRDLARSKKYKTVVALQGDEGMLYAQKYRPSAIILDMQLPVVDGQRILTWLKNDENLKHIPVHVISGADESGLSLDGALAYIQKPVKAQDLEKIFGLLKTQLNVEIKQVMILSEEEVVQNTIGKMIEKRYPDLKREIVKTENEVADKIFLSNYDALIIDMRKELKQGIEKLERLKEILTPTLPVIVYIGEDITPNEERLLTKLSNAVIRESTQSMERLMDELELFLFKIQEVKTGKFPQSLVIQKNKGLEGKKVLLVDDDMRNVFALSTLLEGQEMNVITADNGKEALEMLRLNRDIDIVLMDIMMPEMDGYEATQRIRNDLKMSRLPIIALTAKAMPGDREKVIEAGASDYITKPVDTGQLFSLMRVWLSQ